MIVDDDASMGRAGAIWNHLRRYIARARVSASHLHGWRPCERRSLAGNKKAQGRTPRAFRSIQRTLLLVDGGRALGLLDDAGRLAAQIAEVIKLGTAYLAAAHHLDRVDHRRHHREHAFDAFAVGNLAHGEALVEPAAGAADADAFIGLHAGAIAFHHLDVDDQGIAGPEVGNRLAGGQLFELLFFELLDEVHW